MILDVIKGLNPFGVDGRLLKDIHIYTKYGIKFSSKRGWFDKAGHSTSNNVMGPILIPGDIVYHRTPINFNKVQGPFLVKVQGNTFDKRAGIKSSELYIPYEPSDWTLTEKRTNYNPNYIYVYDVYTHKDGYEVVVDKECIDVTENIEFEADIKSLNDLSGKYQTTVHANRKAILAEIKRLNAKYNSE